MCTRNTLLSVQNFENEKGKIAIQFTNLIDTAGNLASVQYLGKRGNVSGTENTLQVKHTKLKSGPYTNHIQMKVTTKKTWEKYTIT